MCNPIEMKHCKISTTSSYLSYHVNLNKDNQILKDIFKDILEIFGIVNNDNNNVIKLDTSLRWGAFHKKSTIAEVHLFCES